MIWQSQSVEFGTEKQTGKLFTDCLLFDWFIHSYAELKYSCDIIIIIIINLFNHHKQFYIFYSSTHIKTL
jgi:hypothetical protein